MKRVILFDLDEATLDDVAEMEKQLAAKRRDLEKEAADDARIAAERKQYTELIRRAREIHACDPTQSRKDALEEAYAAEKDPWNDYEEHLEFGERPPCVVDDCWCSGNLDRIGERMFYYNVFNSDCIVCDVCRDNGRAPEFDQVFDAWHLARAEKDMQKSV